MRKKIFNVLFIFALLFCFSFGLASCNNDAQPDETQEKQDDNNSGSDSGNNGTQGQGSSEGEKEVPLSEQTLTELPENFYSDLIQAPKSLTITFSEVKGTMSNASFTVNDDSYIKVAVKDETLLANGYFSGTFTNDRCVEDVKAYFTLDGQDFVAKILTTGDPILDKKVTEDEYVTISKQDLSVDEVVYYEISLSKAALFEKINEVVQEENPEFDINNYTTLAEIEEALGVSEDDLPISLDEVKGIATGLFETAMETVFDPSFEKNEIKLTFTVADIISFNDLVLKDLTVKQVFDSVCPGLFDKIDNLTTKYVKVDTTKVTTPASETKYYTYDSTTKEYTEAADLTAWAENTEYYVENKTLGMYTLGDLLITSETDEVGYVTPDQIDQFVDGIIKAFPVLARIKESEMTDMICMMLNQDILSQYLEMILLGNYVPNREAFFEEIEVTEFAEGTKYYTYDAENKKYVEVPTTVTAPAADTKYYVFVPTIGKVLALEEVQDITINQIYANVTLMMSAKELEKMEDEEIAEFMAYVATLDVVDLVRPYVDLLAEAKVYDYIAKAIDTISPVYEEATVSQETFGKGKYFIYNEKSKDYVSASKFAENTKYFAKKPRTAEEAYEVVAEILDGIEEKMTLEVITDNSVKLQKVVLGLDFDSLSGTVTIDFTQDYTDTINETLEADIARSNTEDNTSTRLFEEILTDTVFDNFQTDTTEYKLAKDDDGKIIAYYRVNFKTVEVTEWVNDVEYYTYDATSKKHIIVNTIEVTAPVAGTTYYVVEEQKAYIFGKDDKEHKDYSSEREWEYGHIFEYELECYSDKEKKNVARVTWDYDSEAKKFVTSDSQYEYYYLDYTTNEYVKVDAQFDRKLFNIVDTTKVTAPVAGTTYYYALGGIREFTGEQWVKDTVYYVEAVQIAGDDTHPFIIKKVDKDSGAVSMQIYFYAKVEQAAQQD